MVARRARPGGALTAGAEPFLPFARPDISEDEVAAVVRALRSGWITTGPEVKAFEEEFAAYIGVRHAVALNSCTAALHLGLEALGVGPGDEVLTSTLTFTATAEVCEYLGARSRFVDVDPATLNLSPAALRTLLDAEYERHDGPGPAPVWRHRDTGGRLAALVPVHLGGRPCAMVDLLAIGAKYGVPVLDDAAHALPACVDGRRIGAMGCPTAFSFYATKTLTTGEGGMLTTDDATVAERARMMSLHGISRDAWKRYTSVGSWRYEVLEAGYKYNLTDLAGAMGRAQLRRVGAMRERRAAIAARYAAGLAAVPEVETPSVPAGVEHAWHLYVIRLRLERLTADRARFIQELRDLGIGTSVHFIPLHTQPFYAKKYGYQPGQFPVAEAEFPRLISLPIYSLMSDADVDRVIAAVAGVARRLRR